jgi:hypothetical protein
MTKKDHDKYNQEIDNGLKKKELERKYGAHFSQSGNLSPEMENEWLKHIEKFEEQFNKYETIPVWQYIGKPEYKKVHELKPNEISVELQRISDIMSKNNVFLDTLCEVDDKELYRFITEELFLYEMDNMRIEGMSSCFIYEEFHPNAAYDVEQAFDYFLTMTMAKADNIGGEGYDLLYIDTKNHQDSDGNVLQEDIIKDKINNFLDSFDYFEIHSHGIKRITFDEEKTKAKLFFEIHYTAHFNNSPENMLFKGNGTLKLKPSEYGGWDIYHLNMPGLKI